MLESVSTFLFFFIFLNIFFIIFNFSYKKLFYKKNFVQGSGIIIGILLFLYFYFMDQTSEKETTYFFVVMLLSAIYFIDDIIGLNVTTRIIIQFLSGIICAYIFLDNFDSYFYIKIFLFGLWTIFLTNSMNFYDGKNLNFSFLIICILLFNLIVTNNLDFYILLILFISIIVFSFYNALFKNFYFGDSGCFIVSSFLNYLLIFNIDAGYDKIFFFIMPLLLPFFDVIFVIIFRLYKKENLTTRNHYHLYQRLSEISNSYYYLMPQAITFFTILALYLLYSKDVINFYLLFILSLISIPLLYFYFFKKCLKR